MVVIPSLESMIYSAWRMIDWYKKGKCKASENRCLGVAGFAGKKIDILQGLVSIDGVITKHYTQQR